MNTNGLFLVAPCACLLLICSSVLLVCSALYAWRAYLSFLCVNVALDMCLVLRRPGASEAIGNGEVSVPEPWSVAASVLGGREAVRDWKLHDGVVS